MADKALKKFAADAGVTVVPVDREWGGRFGYRTLDYPGCTICGFQTKNEALRGWAESTFGEHTAKALFKLLGESE